MILSFGRDKVYRTVRVINNNIIIVKDLNGREMIAIGKGLGYKKNKKDFVYSDEIMKTYIYVDKQKVSNLVLFEEIPFEIVEIAQKIIDYATTTLKQKYNVNLLANLSDHINFSVSEYYKGNITPKLVNEEVKRFYKEEYQVGIYAIELINLILGVELQKDEATSIAFHLIVASEETTNFKTRDLMISVRKIVDITKLYLKTEIDEDSLAFSRYVIHLKFFLSRIINKQTIDNTSELSGIFGQLATKYKEVENCVFEIKEFIFDKYNYNCTNEDCIYLMIHILRLYELQGKEK